MTRRHEGEDKKRRARTETGAKLAFVAGALAALASLPGCCGCCDLLPDPRKVAETEAPPEPPSPSDEPPPVGEDAPIITNKSLVNLGVVVYPGSTPPTGAATHSWAALKLKPSWHRLGYALGDGEQRAIRDDFQQFAKKLRYQPDSKKKGQFLWVPPKGCDGDMRCVLEHLEARSQSDVAPIAARLKKRVAEGKLNAMEAATLVVTFIQAIPYEVPKDEPFGLLSPARVAFERRGDCDSKALLGHMLLSSLGVESVVLSSTAHKHAMLGIALPAQGTTISYAGTRYALTETTAKGWPIGRVSPELLRPNDWKVVPIRRASAAGSKGGG